MNVEVNKEEVFSLINLLCDAQINMVRDYPKQEIYKSKKYLVLEELKIKFKEVMNNAWYYDVF